VCALHCAQLVEHNIAQKRPDNFPSYPPDNHHRSDDVYLREGGLPRDEGTYYLDTDASDVGLGAVLSQVKTDKKLCWAMRTEFFQGENETMT